MRLTFTDRTIGKVRSRGNSPPLYSTEARQLLDVSEQVWMRLTKMPGFPAMIRLGLQWKVDASLLADFLAFWNRVESALRIAEVARMCHTSTARVRELLDAGKFRKPLAMVNGSPRWEREEIESWLRETYGDVPMREPRRARGGR
jgi:predicted DNA-binding transcriptional regulator AlpA